MSTHLFNAMSQLGNREPGLVGTTLQNRNMHAGIIVDGIHIHPATLELALRAKPGPGQLFLVSDSMSQAGTDVTEFAFNGRTIYRRDGALRLADGTLAGADLTMDRALRNIVAAGIDLDVALRMASRFPAEAIAAPKLGQLVSGRSADVVHLECRVGSSGGVACGGAPACLELNLAVSCGTTLRQKADMQVD